jgi:hypothetical protein
MPMPKVRPQASVKSRKKRLNVGKVVLIALGIKVSQGA